MQKPVKEPGGKPALIPADLSDDRSQPIAGEIRIARYRSRQPCGETYDSRRIVTNIGTNQLDAARALYGDLLGMTVAMDLGWIMTFTTDAQTTPQISVATEGGSGTSVPDISVEVDNLEEVYQRVVAAGCSIEYGPVAEHWGVKRFYVRDPFGRLLKILAHR